ncbi:MAG: glycogen debranching protein, partial [Bacteroidota bacterium]
MSWRMFSLLFVGAVCCACQEETFDLQKEHTSPTGLVGNPDYLPSPMLTAGNRLYLVGHQDGSFPELGWHIAGEMGGIWNHPIKLMDGFTATISHAEKTDTLNAAVSFTNYPFANVHEFAFPELDLQAERWQFVPDDTEGMVVQYQLRNKGTETRQFDFSFLGYADLRPTWLADRLQIKDGQDTGVFDASLGAWVVTDQQNPWTVVYGGPATTDGATELANEYAGKGFAGQATYRLTLAPREQQMLQFVIAGSYRSGAAARGTYRDLRQRAGELFAAKQLRYAQLAARTKLTVPDKDLERTFTWLKYNCDWLVRTVPEIGTGIGAGLPDYPWWFGVDSEYALQGYMMIGQDQTVRQTIALLDSLSEVTNGNGRIVHEVSTNGVVFNPGNLNETP